MNMETEKSHKIIQDRVPAIQKVHTTMNYKTVDKGASRYIAGEAIPFDQKNEMFKRVLWDTEMGDLGERFYRGTVLPQDNPGYRLEDLSMVNASWHVENYFAQGCRGGNRKLYAWDWDEGYSYPNVPSDIKIDLDDPQNISNGIKKAGKFFGAAQIGICEVDRRWIYSQGYNMTPEGVGAPHEIDIPESHKYAIVIAIEMDYDAIACSPQGPSTFATGLGYSKMAFTAGLLATYIRGLGYNAIPSGNDTACSVPMAIDAGLGELARNGLLITPELGPRLRLAKVFTDLPLIADKPIEFGVWEFCKTCKKCADHCPSNAISHNDPTEVPNDISNREGVLKWHVNAEKCLTFWANNSGIDCSNCIRTCPFNKPKGLLHDVVRGIIRHSRIFNRTLVFMDDLLGYGKKKDSDNFFP